MSYIIEHDSITGRQYYQLTDNIIEPELATKIDFNNLIVVSFNGTTRFLLNDTTLVMAKNLDYTSLYRSLMRYAPINMPIRTEELEHNIFTVSFIGIHASINLACSYCDNGNQHDSSYDFGTDGRIKKNEAQISESLSIDMRFYLTDHQANNTLNAVSYLYEANQQGLYKYIQVWQNCVSVPINTYRIAKLPYHISYFYTDTELLNVEVLGSTIFSDRFYRPDDLSDSKRSEVSAFMKDIYGPEYALNWNNQVNDITIAEQEIDFEKAMTNSAIKNRIEELKILRAQIYGEFVEIWGKDYNIKEEHIKPFIERSFTNEELYYTYTIKYELAQHKLLTQLPYAYKLDLVPFGMDIAKQCLDYNPSYATICAAFCDEVKKNDLYIDNIDTIEPLCNMWQDNGICTSEYEYGL